LSDSCNVEAQPNPTGSWHLGVSADFPTVSATVTNEIVNSVGVRDATCCSDSTEVGWYLRVGQSRYHPFAVSVFNGIYTEYDLTPPAGPLNWKYTVRYYSTGCVPATDPCWIATATSGSTTWMRFILPNPAFSNGTAVTNAERHGYTDTFNVNPWFSNLQVLSSNSWSFWSAAKCYFDYDPLYQNTYYTNPTIVQVVSGSGGC
jgi:hypothetical protein